MNSFILSQGTYVYIEFLRAPPSGGDCPCPPEPAWIFASLFPDGLSEGDIEEISAGFHVTKMKLFLYL